MRRRGGLTLDEGAGDARALEDAAEAGEWTRWRGGIAAGVVVSMRSLVAGVEVGAEEDEDGGCWREGGEGETEMGPRAVAELVALEAGARASVGACAPKVEATGTVRGTVSCAGTVLAVAA
jgi:hypothetical protein